MDLEESILNALRGGKWLSLVDIWKHVRRIRPQTKKKELRAAVLVLGERGSLVRGIYNQFSVSGTVFGSDREPPADFPDEEPRWRSTTTSSLPKSGRTFISESARKYG